MKSFSFAAVPLLVGLVWTSYAGAAPITLTCTGGEGDFGVYFDARSKTLIIDRERNMFDSQKEAHRFVIENIVQDGGAFKVTALEGPGGPRVVVYTGGDKRVEYTELHLASVFEIDRCR